MKSTRFNEILEQLKEFTNTIDETQEEGIFLISHFKNTPEEEAQFGKPSNDTLLVTAPDKVIFKLFFGAMAKHSQLLHPIAAAVAEVLGLKGKKKDKFMRKVAKTTVIGEMGTLSPTATREELISKAQEMIQSLMNKSGIKAAVNIERVSPEEFSRRVSEQESEQQQ